MKKKIYQQAEEEIKSSKSFELQNYERKASKIILAKTIASFSNTEGGNLIIGIKEIKEHGKEDKIIGIEDEFKKLISPFFSIKDFLSRSIFLASTKGHALVLSKFSFLIMNNSNKISN